MRSIYVAYKRSGFSKRAAPTDDVAMVSKFKNPISDLTYDPMMILKPPTPHFKSPKEDIAYEPKVDIQ